MQRAQGKPIAANHQIGGTIDACAQDTRSTFTFDDDALVDGNRDRLAVTQSAEDQEQASAQITREQATLQCLAGAAD
ncbi:MAG: hypothetical protein U5J83_06435 [Bryobacterales bacterium]|nr:hypothetical protein [Bryobacterales bacterium]